MKKKNNTKLNQQQKLNWPRDYVPASKSTWDSPIINNIISPSHFAHTYNMCICKLYTTQKWFPLFIFRGWTLYTYRYTDLHINILEIWLRIDMRAVICTIFLMHSFKSSHFVSKICQDQHCTLYMHFQLLLYSLFSKELHVYRLPAYLTAHTQCSSVNVCESCIITNFISPFFIWIAYNIHYTVHTFIECIHVFDVLYKHTKSIHAERMFIDKRKSKFQEKFLYSTHE